MDLFANRTSTAAEPPSDSFGWLSADLGKFPHAHGCSAPLEHVQEPAGSQGRDVSQATQSDVVSALLSLQAPETM